MAFRTVEDAITQVARHMSVVNGQGMTPYSDELLISYLVAAHQFIIDDQEWLDLNQVHIRSLDGSTGKITQTILATELKDWKQISRVYHESSMTPMPLVTTYNNKLIATNLIGYEPLNGIDDPGPDSLYLLRFYPLILTGQVMLVSHREFDFTDRNLIIPIDWWAHVYHASWQYALDDGTNPGQIKKYETLYNTRMSQVRAKANSRPISQDPYAGLPDIWSESSDPYWVVGG